MHSKGKKTKEGKRFITKPGRKTNLHPMPPCPRFYKYLQPTTTFSYLHFNPSFQLSCKKKTFLGTENNRFTMLCLIRLSRKFEKNFSVLILFLNFPRRKEGRERVVGGQVVVKTITRPGLLFPLRFGAATATREEQAASCRHK